MYRLCRLTAVLAIVLVVYIVVLGSGCSVLPLESAHQHHDQAADAEDQEQKQEKEPPPPEDIDPELKMYPPEVREQIKSATLSEGVERFVKGDAELPPPLQIIKQQYSEADAAAKAEAEKKIAAVVRDSEVDLERRKQALSLVSNFDSPMLDLRIDVAKNAGEQELREAAIGALVTIEEPTKKVFDALGELTEDSDPAIREKAQDILTQLQARGGEFGIHALVQDLGIYRNDASALASTHLVSMGEKTLPYLIEAAKTDSNKYRRAAATCCIAMICAGENPQLRKFSEQAQATRVTKEWKPANPDGVEPMLYVLENDPYPVARSAAAQGLGYLGQKETAGPLADALTDEDEAVRRRAAAALVTVPADDVVPELSEAALNDPIPAVRSYAVRALGQVGNAAVIPALSRGTSDEVPGVRQAAVEQLGRLGADTALEDMVALFEDPNQDVRWAAVRAVGDLRYKEAAPYLIEALKDPSPQVSNAAERGLQKLGIAKRKATGLEAAEQQ